MLICMYAKLPDLLYILHLYSAQGTGSSAASIHCRISHDVPTSSIENSELYFDTKKSKIGGGITTLQLLL